MFPIIQSVKTTLNLPPDTDGDIVNEVVNVPFLPSDVVPEPTPVDPDILGGCDDIFVTGRIFSPKSDQNEAGLYTLCSELGNIRVNLSQVQDIPIFDNMVVSLEGPIEAGILNARRVLSLKMPSNHIIPIQESFECVYELESVMVAVGPFNEPSSSVANRLENIFKHAEKSNVKLLILLGPFLSFGNEPSESRPASMQVAFDDALKLLRSLVDGSIEVVVVPASDGDQLALPNYPMDPYSSGVHDSTSLKSLGIHLLSNPCLFKFTSYQIAVTNHDTMFALSRGGIITDAIPPATNRLQWLMQHMFKEGVIHPGYDVSTTVENGRYETLPTIFITQSKLQRFANQVENVLCVNIGRRMGNAGGMCVIKPEKAEAQSNGTLKCEIETQFLGI